MNGLPQYILSVIAAAILAALISSLTDRGTMGAVVKLLCGIFMALTILSPLVHVRLPDLREWSSAFAVDGELAAEAGAEMANDARSRIIKEEMETYIEDKAALFGAALDVRVRLDEANIPVEVSLTGEFSPQTKEKLVQIIADDLGIEKEDQEWIG